MAERKKEESGVLRLNFMPFHSPDRLEKLPLPLSFLLPFSPSCNNERKERDLKNRRDDFVAVVAGKIGRPNERSLEMVVSEAEHSPSSTKMYLKQYFRNFKLCACVVIGKTFRVGISSASATFLTLQFLLVPPPPLRLRSIPSWRIISSLLSLCESIYRPPPPPPTHFTIFFLPSPPLPGLDMHENPFMQLMRRKCA